MHIYHHSLLPVLAAAVVCLATAFGSIALLWRTLDRPDVERARRLAMTGCLLGCGVWLTHFIALLGFHHHAVARYLLMPTLVSLAIGPAGSAASLLLLRREATRWRSLAAGAGIAFSVTALHYTGMAAIETDGPVAWSAPLVALSVIGALLFAMPAIVLVARRGAGTVMRLFAAMLLAASVIALHFTGMAAIDTIAPASADYAPGFSMSARNLVILITGIGTVLLAWSGTLVWLGRHKERQRLRELRQFELLMNGVKDTAIYMIDVTGDVLSWNKGAMRLKGYAPDHILGKNFARFYTAEDRERGAPLAALRRALEDGAFEELGWRVRSDGSSFFAAVAIEPIFDEQGRHCGFAKVTRDVTSIRQMEHQLDTALNHMRQGLLLFDDAGRLVLYNRQVQRIFKGGAMAQSLTGRRLSEVIDALVENLLADNQRRAGANEMTALVENLLARHSGGATTAEIGKNLVVSIAANPMPEGGCVITLDDVTEQHNSAKRLEFMANHDSLTGLPNRDRFTQLTQESLERTRANGTPLLLAIVDLNNFKEINDNHGHDTGDDMLREVAVRLRRQLRKKGEAARLGGDEFALFAHVADAAEAAALAEQITGCIDFGMNVNGEEVRCSGSLGFALASEDGITTKELFSNADLAMYRAKRAPSLSWCRYSGDMDEEARERRELQADLRMALERDEFHIDYQVQCSVRENAITGYEALLRWNHPVKGLVSPESFIIPAEESGLILSIGEWVLRTVCHEAAAWGEPYKVAVNVSAVQLVQENFPEIVTTALLDAGLAARRLEIEVTETAIISDKLRALHNLRRVKALGVSIAIDDFGTGYSSLDTLNSFAFDKIKIDRSFLMGVKKGDHSRTIVKAVLALGRSLNLPVLAEGVETEEDVKLLREENCEEAQGFYFGRPSKQLHKPFADCASAGVALPPVANG